MKLDRKKFEIKTSVSNKQRLGFYGCKLHCWHSYENGQHLDAAGINSYVWHYMVANHTLRAIVLWTQPSIIARIWWFMEFNGNFCLYMSQMDIKLWMPATFCQQHVRVNHCQEIARNFILKEHSSWTSTCHHLIYRHSLVTNTIKQGILRRSIPGKWLQNMVLVCFHL